MWAAVIGSPRGRSLFEAAAAGREQSLQLEHVMTVDWDEPLIPPGKVVRRSCTCPDADRSGTCKHVIALAYVFADAIDDDPSLLLEWRGCSAVEEPREPVALRPEPTADAWTAGPLPELGPARPLPVGSVLKRLGRSGLVVDGTDLRDALEPAYAAFAGRDELERSQNAVRGAAAPLTFHSSLFGLEARRRRARGASTRRTSSRSTRSPSRPAAPKPRPSPGPPGPPWP